METIQRDVIAKEFASTVSVSHAVARAYVDDLFDTITDFLLEGHVVEFRNWGKLVPTRRATRPVQVEVKKPEKGMKMLDEGIAIRTHHTHSSRVETLNTKITTGHIFSELQKEKVLKNKIGTTFYRNSEHAKTLFTMFLGMLRDLLTNTNLRIEVRNLGVFTSRTRPERPSRNPRTGERIIAKEAVFPKFRPAKKLMEQFNAKWVN